MSSPWVAGVPHSLAMTVSSLKAWLIKRLSDSNLNPIVPLTHRICLRMPKLAGAIAPRSKGSGDVRFGHSAITRL